VWGAESGTDKLIVIRTANWVMIVF
jgi:hypothetical protein